MLVFGGIYVVTVELFGRWKLIDAVRGVSICFNVVREFSHA